MNMRTLALPALAASVVLSLSACDPTHPAAPPADPTAAAARAAADDSLPAATLTDDQPVTLVNPGTSATAPSTGAAAPPAASTAGAPGRTAAAPSAVPSSASSASSVRPAVQPSGTPTTAGAPDLKLASYDRSTGTAVLAVVDAGKGSASPTPGAGAAATPTAAATAAAAAAVKPGQLIDSPPTAAAPHGALLAITDVKPAAAGKVAVGTRPATISELLGRTWADIKAALDPHKIQVTPKLKNLKASYVPRPDGGDGSATATLQLNADDSVPLPGGGKATLSGSVEIDPTVMFSYRGTDGLLAAEQAKVGFDLGAHADWHLTASLTGSTGQVRIPIAALTATPTVMVGQVPVVITLNLTVYAEVSANGNVTVDVAQTMDGSWGVHADYTRAAGWTSATEPVTTTVSPVKASFAGSADVRSGLVADGSVALYDTVGVKVTVEPYLRAAVEGRASIDSSAGKPVVTGSAGLYGGLDVNGAVMARIAILGTPLLEKDLPFKTYHREWPLLAASSGNAASPK